MPALPQGQFDLAVLTCEQFAGQLSGNAHLLGILSLAVIDEVRNIVDHGRSANLEFLLALLVALSAVPGDWAVRADGSTQR